ncbi:fat-like cadherin-related tumor suppressor homolog, partial [Amphibalanus amphitrite]|uniref:fat-like cadherin-related tumor suppressor homolog n=1 Tax=Amphibalanus amphitrite TaxID=1232801 RepID=UPI001C90A621
MAPSSGARPRRPRPAPRLLRPRPAPWLISQLLLLAAVCRLGTAAAADDEWTLQFTQSFYNASIYENNVGKEYVISDEPMGLRVPEDQLGREIRFKIIDGDPDSFFKVQQQVVGDFCFLRVRTRTNGGDVLNRERQSHFRLKVRAAARGWRRPGGRQPAYTEVLVRVLDRNDLSPWFDQVSYDVEVPEDLPVHGLVTKLHADDADAGINGMVYYSLKEDEPQFAMEPSTGRLTLARRLNHRQRPDFQLTAVARDRGRKDGPGVPGEAPLRIRVRPVNLFDPVMRVTHLSEVVEHSSMDVYAIIHASDQDEGEHGRVASVRIVDGDPQRRFRVLPGSAVGEWLVGVSEPLDRESAPHGFNLTLNATDAGTPPRSSGLSVRVRVTDFNDHAPAFTHEAYDVTVPESALAHTPLVRLRASDSDSGLNAQVRYAIAAGNEGGEFSINSDTGLLSLARPLDAETKAFYALTVSALDQGSGGRQRQGSARVTVTVTDENDNAPRFVTPNTQAAVDENEPADHHVTSVTCEDGDQSENAFLSYSIANTEPVPFIINHFDGTISTSQVLDYETERRQYILRVRCSDWGKPYRWQTETTVTIQLRNVNDNRPQFEKVDCHGRLWRRAAVGTEIMVLSAIDFDDGAAVSYRLVSGNEDGCFELDERSGSLRVACDLTDLPSDQRKLGVMANDGQHFSDETQLRLQLVGDGAPHGASVRLECKDTGVAGRYRELLATAERNNREEDPYTDVPSSRYGTNYHRPQLSARPDGELHVSEDARLGTDVVSLIGHDKDLGFNGLLVFAITEGDQDSVFDIDMDTGKITIAGRLDRERAPTYRLNVTACDRGQPQLCAALPLIVHILDVNDNAPKLERDSFTFFYPETREAGQMVVQLNASDPDEGANGRVSYHLLTDTDDFAVNSETGLVTQVGALDRERQSSYELRVAARDGAADRPLSSHAVIHIDVLDVNDNPPRFSRSVYRVRASEDLPVGAVVAQLEARDPDSPEAEEPVQYRVVTGGHGRFGVDRRSGAVRLLEPLDFERRQSYNVTIEARDDGSPLLTAVAYLFVQVVDVNENYFAPSFRGAVAVSGSVREGLPPGTFVLAVRATDADPDGPNSEVTYSIRGGNGLGHFTINQTGIYTRDVLDRESRSSYWLTVYAKDGGAVPLSARIEVYIEVDDVNDNCPLTSEPVYHAEVLENSPAGTHVARVTATDRDGDGPLTYSIAAGNPQSLFSINSKTGEITTTRRKLDRETQERYILEVAVADWGVPQALTSTARVKVTVLDENDSPPVFPERLYRVQVPLGPALRRPNATIFQVTAEDADAGVNAELRYSVVATDGVRMDIEPRLGQLRLPPDSAGQLTAGKHALTVKATDGGSPAKSSVTRVLLDVLPEQPAAPYPPRVMLPSDIVQVFETEPVGHLVQFAAANTTVLFSIVGGNTGGSFSVNSPGGIVIARPLDWETTPEYTLNISATDGHHVIYTPLHISVMDLNDREPTLSQRLYSVNVSEAAEPGLRLVSVAAHDPDGEATLYYGLEAAQSERSLQLFAIDSLSGRVTVAERLDRETEHEHVLTVSVRDQGTPARRDYARLVIHVTDENDHGPTFLSDLVVGQVPETAAEGTQVVTVLATDRDHGENARVTYSIQSGNVDNAFRVDPVQGTVEVATALDRRRTSEYILTVRASDAGRPPRHAEVHVNIIVTLPDNAPPRFEKAEYGAEVEEDWEPGTHVLDVMAHCKTALIYRLVGGNEDGAFLLNPGAGVVTVNERLDYERRTWYNLSIQAVSMVGEVAHTSVIIHVLDVNDNAPRLEQASYAGRVLESAPVGSAVLSATDGQPLVVTAIDTDDNSNGRLEYSIVETAVRRYISIDADSGVLRTAASLDHETRSEFEFTVDVWDRGRPRLQAVRPARVKITVLDVNDESPQFSHAQYNFTVLTPSYDGVEVGVVTAADPDTANVSYSLSGADASLFSLDPDSGSLRVLRAESVRPLANVTVTASDGAHNASTAVVVRSREVASRGLVFTKQHFYGEVRENSSRVDIVASLSVRGNQLMEHLEFRILNPSPYFSITRTAGVVRTTGLVLDREQQDQHVLAVQVRSDRDGRVAHTLLHCTVMDVNDNRPVFVGQPYHAVVAVDASAGAPVTKVTAVDADLGENGQVHYDLLRGNGDLFAVDQLSGAITLRRSPRGMDTAFRLVVTAYDGGSPPLSSEVEVLVTTVDGTQPRFSQPHYWARVSEAAERRTPVLTVEAAAPSPSAAAQLGSPLVFQLSSAEQPALFDVDFTTGVLYVTGELDYETSSRHQLTVTATDRVTGSVTSVPVTVNVTDANDNAPQFEQLTYSVTASEAVQPGVRLMTVTATDRDEDSGRPLIYRVQKADGSESFLFHMSADGGLMVRSYLDYELERSHRLVLTVSDDGSPPLTGTAQLTVNVEDINDNMPTFERASYHCRLTELPVRGQFVTMVSAHDPDNGDEITYRIADGNDRQMFYINKRTGVITVANIRAFGDSAEYHLNISAADGVHHTYVPLVVELLPANKHAPAFDKVAYETDVREDVSSGTEVVRVRAVDPDRGQFGQVTYSIPSDVWREVFTINATTGVVSTRQLLDREARPLLEFSVWATDGGHRSDHAIVKLRLTDVNDNLPRFQLEEYRATVGPDSSAGDVVCKVFASDADEGDNARIAYSIYETEKSDIRKVFDINTDTGEIILMQQPAELESAVYQLFVRATDGGSEPLVADVPVDVVVLADSQGLPVFDPLRTGPQGLFLKESDPVGTRITSVQARGTGTLTYSVVSVHNEPSADMFEVDADGQLILAKSLDRESVDRYNITIAARSDALPPLVAYSHLMLSVMDANDNDPVFDAQVYSGTVREGLPAGTRALQVSASDPDISSSGQVRYRLSADSGHLHSVLAVDERYGWVTTLRPLDRETQDTYRLSVVATDRGSPRRSATASVVITVADENDSPPVFERSRYVAVVNEDALPRTAIMRLSTSDADEINEPVRFYITAGDPHTQFEIVSSGSNSGELFVLGTLDRETVPSYDLAVTATDGSQVATTVVHIDVLDANDNAPECEEEHYQVTLSEAAPPQHVLTVRATDADDSRNGRLLYYLAGDGAEDFSIDAALGHVKVSGTLDRETRPVYHLVAHVQDRGRPEWECTSRLTVALLDVNDCPPRFPQSVVSLTVPEDTPVNTILGRLHASDDDLGASAELEYSLVDSEESQLLLDPRTGVLTLARPLDREQQAMFNISVMATDGGSPALSGTAAVILLVQDVNDNAPEFTKTMYHASAYENTTVGTEVLKLLATSRDSGVNAEISYSIIGGNEHNMFEINRKTGIVSVTAQLDFERAREYMVTVEARDGGTPPLSNHATVNVTVLDCNDNTPVFGQEVYSAVIREDVPTGERVLQVHAADLDAGTNARVRYSLTGGDPHGQFAVDCDTGHVYVATQLDREMVSSYGLEVTATDMGEPSLSSTAQINVHVSDANDNPPVFSQAKFEAVIQEDKAPGHELLQLTVTDADEEPNAGPFTFEVADGNAGNWFVITPGGQLRTAAKFDHRQRDTYRLLVRVYDNGEDVRFSETWVDVKIIEEPQYPPVLIPLHVSIQSYQDSFPGAVVGRVHASDQDPYDRLQYSLTAGPGQAGLQRLFELDPDDGSLVTLAGIDAGLYRLNVSVTDGKFTSYTDVTVEVRDITEQMARHAVGVKLDALSPYAFVLSHLKSFRRALRKQLKVRSKDILVLSVQRSGGGSGRRRRAGGSQPALEVLLAVRRGPAWMEPAVVRRRLKAGAAAISRQLGVQLLDVDADGCEPSPCGGHGVCSDVAVFDREQVVSVATDVVSFVSPRHSREVSCECHVGFGGELCTDLVNECGRAPCADYQLCIPDGTAAGFTCRCPDGRTGPRCDLLASECREGQCYTPGAPFSLSGDGFAEYRLMQAQHSRSSLRLSLRTRQPTATLVYAADGVEYSILELVNGQIQYRFDCGSGEGLVLVPDTQFNDDRWHNVVVKRFGNRAEILVDGDFGAQGVAPGYFDVLSVASRLLFVGAEVAAPPAGGAAREPRRGFTGCLDNLELDGERLPRHRADGAGSAQLVRTVGVSAGCGAALPEPGVCDTQPCLNGARCAPAADRPGGFSCLCAPRFSGARCEVDSDPCASAPCLNGGVCSAERAAPGGYRCDCAARLTGDRCQYGLHCAPNPCLNGGACEDGTFGPLCKCRGFTGPLCAVDVNECLQSPCRNGATCVNVPGSFRCQCAANWTGQLCSLAAAPAPAVPLSVTLEHIVGLVAVVLALFLLALLIVCWRQSRRKRSRTPRQRANGQDASNEILLQTLNSKNPRGEYQRMSKVSNLEANSSAAGTLPARPASFTGAANSRPSEPPYSTLNNLDTIRSYGSAADDLDVAPSHSACQYLQNFNKPTASVAPSMAATASDVSASNTLEKTFRDMDKTSNRPTTTCTRYRMTRRTLSWRAEPNSAATAGQAATSEYHWDCSDWAGATSQTPLPNITEVP